MVTTASTFAAIWHSKKHPKILRKKELQRDLNANTTHIGNRWENEKNVIVHRMMRYTQSRVSNRKNDSLTDPKQRQKTQSAWEASNFYKVKTHSRKDFRRMFIASQFFMILYRNISCGTETFFFRCANGHDIQPDDDKNDIICSSFRFQHCDLCSSSESTNYCYMPASAWENFSFAQHFMLLMILSTRKMELHHRAK